MGLYERQKDVTAKKYAHRVFKTFILKCLRLLFDQPYHFRRRKYFTTHLWLILTLASEDS